MLRLGSADGVANRHADSHADSQHVGADSHAHREPERKPDERSYGEPERGAHHKPHVGGLALDKTFRVKTVFVSVGSQSGQNTRKAAIIDR